MPTMICQICLTHVVLSKYKGGKQILKNTNPDVFKRTFIGNIIKQQERWNWIFSQCQWQNIINKVFKISLFKFKK